MAKVKQKEQEATLPLGDPKQQTAAARVPSAKAAKSRAVATVKPGQHQPAAPAPGDLLTMLARAAADPNVDVAKMREIKDLIREVEEDEARRKFNAAFLAARREMPEVVKDRVNDHTRSKYATLENVSRSIDATAHKHGFAHSFTTADSPLPGHYRIECRLLHDSGYEHEPFRVDLQADTAGAKGTSNKTPIHGTTSTISYARRVLKTIIWDIAIIGDDKDGNAPQRREVPKHPDADTARNDDAPISPEEALKLVELLEESGIARDKFCDRYGINAVSMLPRSMYAEAVKACRDYAAKRKGR